MDFSEIYHEWIIILGDQPARKSVGRIPTAKKCMGRKAGIEFIIHPNEQGHNKAHLHAKYQNKEVVIGIPDGELISGNIPLSKQKLASKWVKDNSNELKRNWNELTNGIKISI